MTSQRLTFLLLALTFLLGVAVATTSEDVVRLGTLLDLDGQPRVVESTQGQAGIAVFFLSVRCPCAKNCLKEVLTLIPRFQKQKYKVVFVSTDQKTPRLEAARTLRKLGLGSSTYFDSGGNLAARFRVRSASEFVVLERDGEIRYHGSISDENQNFAEKFIEDIEAGRKFRFANARGIGCALEDLDSFAAPWDTSGKL
ncbi:MAG: TlpA family protein disulfide reductase [Bdellovibrio sp.]